MDERHDGFSDCAVSNFALLMESARDVIEGIRELSSTVEARVMESAPMDEIIPLLMEKRDRVGVLRDLSREITVSLGASETGKVGVPLSDNSKQQFLDLVAEFQDLIDEESTLENLVCKQGLRISARRK
ncbi:MAG: hypothetical protein PVF95_10265 [bacterium]|jgi:hypothetical protein